MSRISTPLFAGSNFASIICIFHQLASQSAMTTPPDPEVYSNPVRLSVATRESNSSSNAVAGPSTNTKPLNERERLFEARKANEIVRRKGEKWADKLMEETVDRDTFKRAVGAISHTLLNPSPRRHHEILMSPKFDRETCFLTPSVH
jgi:hypothetical protein